MEKRIIHNELPYALNAARELVHVDSVPNGNKCGCFCPKCGESLCAKNGGEKRTHHFSHISGSDCPGAYETMLHILAKEKFYERFYSDRPFKISFEQNASCNEINCKLRSPQCSSKCCNTNIDIKKLYDTCEKEKSISQNGQNYIADLLLTNSHNSNITPLLIEIFVSHQCEEDKINSGLKILEFKIENEDYLNELIQRQSFDVDNRMIFNYGFKPHISKKLTIDIKRLYHNPDSICSFTSLKCDEANKFASEDSDLEVNIISNDDNYEVEKEDSKLANYFAKQFGLEACPYCQHYECYSYGASYCKKYGKFDLQKNSVDDCFERAKLQYIANEIEWLYKFDIIKRPAKTSHNPYYVIIAASKAFVNDEFLLNKCEAILKDKLQNPEIVVICAIASWAGGANGYLPARHLAEKHGLLIRFYEADWEKDGKKAAYYMYKDALRKANELIFFWDGKEPYYIVNEAERNQIPYTIIDYSNERALCPKCGCTMVMRNSKRGYFWGCIRFPDCDGIRETNKREIQNILQQDKNSPGNYNISTLNPK